MAAICFLSGYLWFISITILNMSLFLPSSNKIFPSLLPSISELVLFMCIVLFLFVCWGFCSCFFRGWVCGVFFICCSLILWCAFDLDVYWCTKYTNVVYRSSAMTQDASVLRCRPQTTFLVFQLVSNWTFLTHFGLDL